MAADLAHLLRVLGGNLCVGLSHAKYPDEEAQRSQRAGDSFPVGVCRRVVRVGAVDQA